MKSIKVVTKRQAENAMLGAFFHGKGTATTMRYDGGKYTGKVPDYYGREFEVRDTVVAIWPEARTDKEGAYVILLCCSL